MGAETGRCADLGMRTHGGGNDAVKEQVQQMWPRGQAVRTGLLRGVSGRAGQSVCGDGQVHGRIWEREAEVKRKRRSLGMRKSKNRGAKGCDRLSKGP